MSEFPLDGRTEEVGDGAPVPLEPEDDGIAFAGMCAAHGPWAVDRTGGSRVPAGWVGVVDAMLAASAGLVGGDRARVIAFERIAVNGRALVFDVRPEPPWPGLDRRGAALRRVVRAATLASLSTCPGCGAAAAVGRIACPCPACGSPDGADAVGDAPFPLYAVRDVAAALGVDPVMPPDEFEPPDGTPHQLRLLDLLRAGDRARWRELARPDPAALRRLDAVDLRAPHLREATDVIRLHVRAALAMGSPIWFPPMLLLGEPGLGKSWFLSRVASALGVPFRCYPMNVATLGEGLSGSHPSWRNSQPGLVARTLLSEAVANPLILVDEADKPPGHLREDPFRPFYTLLEPEGARAFADEYLGFPMDASRVSWVLAGNAADPLPAPIIDRLRVVRVPAMDAAQRGAVAASIYADLNAERRNFFARALGPAVRERLAVTHPRGMRRALVEAMARAAADGRRGVLPEDVVVERAPDRRVGFVRGDPR